MIFVHTDSMARARVCVLCVYKEDFWVIYLFEVQSWILQLLFNFEFKTHWNLFVIYKLWINLNADLCECNDQWKRRVEGGFAIQKTTL